MHFPDLEITINPCNLHLLSMFTFHSRSKSLQELLMYSVWNPVQCNYYFTCLNSTVVKKSLLKTGKL